MKRTKKEIRDKLIESLQHEEGHPEYGIYTRADSMINGGAHYWYLGNSKYDVRCYGCGPGWCDQSDESSLDLDEAVNHIHQNLVIVE
jgi:hypothetical protein